MRVVLIDREPIFREGVKNILTSKRRDIVMAESDTYCRVDAGEADIVIIDGEVEAIAFLAALREIGGKGRPPFVLVLTRIDDDQHIADLIKAGANGYLHKSTPLETLLVALNRIERNGQFVPGPLAEKLAFYQNEDTSRSRLTQRERQVLSLYANGMGVSEIANALSLSLPMINTYRYRLLEKLHLQSNAQLIQNAHKAHVVE